MAYISDYRKWFGMGFPKKEILMDYISRSCDLSKKEIFDSLHKHFGGTFFKNYQKRKFDGLHKQIM